MNFTSIDLELDQPSNKIIQLGAVIANLDTGEILEKVSYIIKYPDKLNPFIIKLTGITDEMITTEGISLHDAYVQLKTLHKKHNCFMNPITWGGGDSVELKAELETDPQFIPTEWCFGRRWIDCKTVFITLALGAGAKMQSGLAKSMVRMGLSFSGRKHWATDDALNTFILYRHLVKSMPQGVLK